MVSGTLPAGITAANGRFAASNDYQDSLEIALAVLKLDPRNERAHRAAIYAYWKLGELNAAISQYNRCKELLATELATKLLQKPYSFMKSC